MNAFFVFVLSVHMYKSGKPPSQEVCTLCCWSLACTLEVNSGQDPSLWACRYPITLHPWPLLTRAFKIPLLGLREKTMVITCSSTSLHKFVHTSVKSWFCLSVLSGRNCMAALWQLAMSFPALCVDSACPQDITWLVLLCHSQKMVTQGTAHFDHDKFCLSRECSDIFSTGNPVQFYNFTVPPTWGLCLPLHTGLLIHLQWTTTRYCWQPLFLAISWTKLCNHLTHCCHWAVQNHFTICPFNG